MSETDHEMTTRDLAGMTPAADEPVSRDGGDEKAVVGEGAPAPTHEGTGADDTTAFAEQERPALLESGDAAELERRWRDLQTSFVDEPRRTVEEADALVADLMQRLARGFAEQRSRLEGQWDRGDDVSTEDLRVALTRYRSFFQRLLEA
jgi:hypothetical protein